MASIADGGRVHGDRVNDGYYNGKGEGTIGRDKRREKREEKRDAALWNAVGFISIQPP